MKLKQKKMSGLSRSLSALLVAGLMASTAQAGKIISVDSDPSVPPNTAGFVAGGFGGWNLDNVEVILNESSLIDGDNSLFNESNGFYYFSPDADFTYQGEVDDGTGAVMGQVLAKDWPVGEPSGIKIVNDDLKVQNDKPMNCIMATSYLADHFLDSADPQQVICSSGFQTHKRYKLAMLPLTVDGGAGAEEGVDLVFNVEVDGTFRDYQVFQKINNWTDGRLEGFTIQVGFGIGGNFVPAGEGNLNLYLTVPSDIWSATQLANFSEGLFGPFDDHTETIGFFDPDQRAGFLIQEYEITETPTGTDTLHSGATLGSDYAQVPPQTGPLSQFGPWLSNSMLPQGIFFDDDGNPETDAELLAWYGLNPTKAGGPGLGWMSGSQGSDEDSAAFSAILDGKIAEMGANLSYTMGEIDDLVNVGLNYVVTVGDVNTFSGGTFTIRITPLVDTSGIADPAYVDIDPVPLLLFTSSDAEVLLEPAVEFVIGSLLTARVGDADMNQDGGVAEEVDVTITSTSLSAPGPLTLTLIEQGLNRGVFAATLPDEFSNVDVDTVVTMSYTDADDGLGGTDVVKTSSTKAVVELTPLPPTSDVSITDLFAPEALFVGQTARLNITLTNAKEAETSAAGFVTIEAEGFDSYSEPFDLAPNRKLRVSHNWTVVEEGSVEWTATVTFTAGQSDSLMDTAVTVVTLKPGNSNNNGNN